MTVPRPAPGISLATLADVTDVVALDRACFGVDAWSEESVRTALVGPHRVAVVARTQGTGAAGGAEAPGEQLAGYAVAARAGDVLDVQRVAVVPAQRRTGLATRLFEVLRREGEVSRAGRLMLEVSADNEAGRAFYAAQGMTEVARRPAYYRDGSDALVLELPLGTAEEDDVEAHLADLLGDVPGDPSVPDAGGAR